MIIGHQNDLEALRSFKNSTGIDYEEIINLCVELIKIRELAKLDDYEQS